MSARRELPTRRSRRGRWLAGGLVLLVVAGASVWLAVDRDTGAPSARAASAVPRTAPPPTVTADPLPSDASLSSAAPEDVPMTVLAAAPGLPPNMAPVGLGAPSRYGDGVSVRLLQVQRVDARATRPGEISGPAVAVRVQITDGGGDAVSLDTVAVNVYAGPQAVPCVVIHDGATQPLHGSLAAGSSESATYVFRLPASEHGDITVTVAHGVGADGRTAVFSGSIG
jgi:hypothetical protein